MAVPVQAIANESDIYFVRSILAGNERAASGLRAKYHAKLVGILCARGATKTEAEDVIADLWSDCFGATERRSSILIKYQGRCALESWLVTVATNRFIELKRRQQFRSELSPCGLNPLADPLDAVPGATTQQAEPLLLDLLHQSVLKAFSESDPETLLMLKLVHIHGVTQREIGRMWRWHESKVCRVLDLARQNIKKSVLARVKRTDPWLRFTWEDFSDLCRCLPFFFGASETPNRLQDRKVRQSKRGAIRSSRLHNQVNLPPAKTNLSCSTDDPRFFNTF
jgi:RNA polymerase sigma factor (sigma-70 family)